MEESLKASLRSLDEFELRRAIIYAQGLLEGTDGPVFEPLETVPTEPGDSAGSGASVRYRRQWVRCGKDNCSSCPHGPYWYAYWREGGRQRSRYVGKEAPPGAEVES